MPFFFYYYYYYFLVKKRTELWKWFLSYPIVRNPPLFLCFSLCPPLSSYLHCEWSTLEQLERDKRIHQKLKRFKIKYTQMRNLFQEVSRSNQVVVRPPAERCWVQCLQSTLSVTPPASRVLGFDLSSAAFTQIFIELYVCVDCLIGPSQSSFGQQL